MALPMAWRKIRMSSNKRRISKQTIDMEIYKTFEQFKKQNKVTTAKYLKHLDINFFPKKNYRKIKFEYESLIRLILYKKIKGFRFNTKLTKHLRRNPKDKYQLGFSQTPDRTQIGYFNNHILDEQTQQLLEYTVDKIIEVSEKFNILLDINTLESIKPTKITKERNQRHQKNIKTKDVCKLFKKRLTPFIDLHQHHNVTYSKNELINLLIHLGLSQDFAENGGKIYKELNRHGPSGKTLLYHLKKIENIKDLQKMYQTLFEIVWTMVKQANLFNTRKPLDVAIDYTEWFYYGKDGKMVTSKKPERGTSRCYKFATINIVENGKRFTLLALPVNVLDNKEKILTKLILYAKQRIKIKHVYLDRGFFDSVSIRTINNLHVKYLMPAIQNYNVRKIMKLLPAPSVVPDFILKNTQITLVVVMLKDRATKKLVKRVFATNMDIGENDVALANRLGMLYSKRWGIETSYRVKKHSFRGKTTSKNYIIRLFYFLFSVLLYNLWILADVLVWLHLYGIVEEGHLVTSKYFGTVLMSIDQGGG